MKRPRVMTKCVAQAYAAPNERIVEFSDGRGKGGLIALHALADGRLRVDLYRLDAGVEVTVTKHTDNARICLAPRH